MNTLQIAGAEFNPRADLNFWALIAVWALVDVKIAIDAWKPDVSASKAYRVHSKHRNIAIFWYARSYKARTAHRLNTGLC